MAELVGAGLEVEGEVQVDEKAAGEVVEEIAVERGRGAGAGCEDSGVGLEGGSQFRG